MQTVRDMIRQNNFYVVKSKELKWNTADAQSFYSEHKGTIYLLKKLGGCAAASTLI